jgi:hypothetical protein
MIIPSNRKNDNKYAIAQRNALRQRVVTTVATTLADNSPAIAKAPLRKSSDSAQMKIAQQHLLSNHGIERRNSIYIEICCSIHRYPHRDDYVSDILPVSEITLQLRQHEGIYVTLLDYQPISSNSDASNVVHI